MTLLAPLVSLGFYSPSLQKSDRIVLDKPGKASYDSPSSFHLIVLLQTFLEILARGMRNQLSCLARASGLINPHHCGSLVGLATSDAFSTFTHDVRTLLLASRKASTLFLDN